MTSSSSTIRIAILGGGLAGVAVLRGLLRYPHVAADIYESHPDFREEGPAIELSSNTQAILRAIDPALDQCLARAGAVPTSTEVRVAAGLHAGQRVATNGTSAQNTSVVSRQAFLTELTAGLPPRIVHLNSRLSSICEVPGGNGLSLVFADGSRKKYDVVIGADDIQGISRAHVLGADDPSVAPEATGFWGLYMRVPLGRAQNAMGNDFLDPDKPTQMCWIGDGNLMQHGLLNNCEDVQIATYARIDEDADGHESQWVKLFTPEEFEEIFAKCEPDVCKGMIKLVQSVYTVQIAGLIQMQHKPARTYTSRNACLMGDSAHAMLPFQSATVTIALEEALVLSNVLGRASSKEAVPAALQAFDRVCRPRAERAVQSTFQTGLLLTGNAPGIGLDASRLSEALLHSGDFLHDFDIRAHLATAINIMDQMLG